MSWNKRAELAVGVLITIIVVDDVQLRKTTKVLATTEDNLLKCVAERDGCRQGVHEFMAEMEKLKTQDPQREELDNAAHDYSI